ncbi:MAG: nitrous oxide-stimulated promoter family protein [Myxococcales bacterium]|nr:nitrous oxide-stimulated promoter family protein [Myxococcales bacterium]
MRAAKTVEKDQRILRRFVGIYCRAKHGGAKNELCRDCADLLAYALRRLEACPLDPKPSCKKCPVHCYRAAERKKMREVMRFSGMQLIKHGRLDWLARYFF